MDGREARNIIRTYLGDLGSVTEQGTFWVDIELYSACNIAQYQFIRFAVQNSYVEAITNLIKEIYYSDPPPYLLPTDYYIYLSAYIKQEKDEIISWKPCKIYTSGDFYPYVNSRNSICFIGDISINNSTPAIHFWDNASYPDEKPGRLIYVRKPRPILPFDTGVSFPNEYPDDIYKLIFFRAIIILAMKELTNMRDLKTLINYTSDREAFMKPYVNYLLNEYDKQPAEVQRKEGNVNDSR